MNKYRTLLFSLALLYTCFCRAQTGEKPITIGHSINLASSYLKEDRTINIYLPENYQANDTVKYPVIYILDGGLEEDFLHLTGIVRFNTQSWIARFPPSIVVGIAGNTRKQDFTFAVKNLDFLKKAGFPASGFPKYGGSEAYMNFIEKELQPYLNKNYSVGSKRTIIGESLAGLFATEVLLKRPALFDDYIIISPSLWWDGGSLLNHAARLLSTHLKKPVNVYLGVPSKEEDTRMYAAAASLNQVIRKNKNIHSVFDYMPEELHSTVIHQAVYNAFKKLYPKTAYSK